MHRFSLLRLSLLTAISAGLAACGGNAPTLTVPVSAPNAYLLTSNDQIVGVDLDSMEFARSVRTIPRISSGTSANALETGEFIQDIDYRNSEGAIYALTTTGTSTGTKGRIIRIDPSSGGMLRISELSTNLKNNVSYTIDFDPVEDRLRVIDSDGTTLVVDVMTGDTITTSNNASGTITGAAHTDEFDSTGRKTQLFTLDAANNRLNLPSTTKPLLANRIQSIDGYDINPANNTGLALLSVGDSQQFYKINPDATGNAASAFAIPPRLTGGIRYKAFTFITTANPTVTALTSANSIHSFRANQPNDVSNAISLTPLASGETVLGLDFRQSDRTMYALTSSSKIYSVATDGLLNEIRTLGTPLNSSTKYTLDFDPVQPTTGSTQNRLRLIGEDRSNALINVEDGTVTTNGPIIGTPTTVVKAAAYLNNFRSTSSTNLLVIDRASSTLNVQNIGTGALTRQSALGIVLDANSPVGFDISGRFNENQLLMARTASSGNFSLYRVNSGATSNPLTRVGTITGSDNFIDIAIRF